MQNIPNKTNGKHQLWIDILKGMGILSIIYAHTTDHKGVFIYAVPLFFILSGYLHRPMDDFKFFFKKSLQRMLVPYLVFFLLISFYHVVAVENPWVTFLRHIKLLIWGGSIMAGDFGVFWFINVLFIGLNLFNYMQVKHAPSYIYLILFLLSNSLFLWNINLPWSIQNLPIVLSYMFVGAIIKVHWNNDNIKRIATVNKCIIGGVVVAIMICMPNIYLDIKYNHYGIFLLSFTLSIIAVILLTIISVQLEKCRYLSSFLAYCGKASLFLMFVHQFIHFKMHFVSNKYVVFILTALISLIFYFVSSKFRLGRKLLCGEK